MYHEYDVWIGVSFLLCGISRAKFANSFIVCSHAVTYVPEDYDRLLYDVFRGKRTAFVRADENLAAWRIFEPLIHQLETERVRPLRYNVGSDGPVTAEELFKR